MEKTLLIIISLFMLLSCKDDKIEKQIIVSTKSECQNGIKKYNFFKKNGVLDKTLEYINFCGKDYLNQGWYFKENGDTLYERSNFYKIVVPKNILKPMETTSIKIYYKPLLKNSISVLLLNKDINLDYSNLDKVKLDTLYFVKNKLEFYQGFKSRGKTNIGGYIYEIKILKDKINNHNIYDERKLYFKIPFEVR